MGILEIFKHRSTCMDNDWIEWIIRASPHEFQNWVHTISCLSVLSSVDFLRWCGSIVMSKCIPICVHRQHTKHWHLDSWYLNGSLFCVCAGTWVGLIFGFQRHLSNAGIDHTFHASVPDGTLVVHSPDVEWCYCNMGQFGDTCWCVALYRCHKLLPSMSASKHQHPS